MNAVTLDNVCKSFGQVHAVDNLSVQVPAGSVYGFLGPNGAGKTTTLRMIMNIIRPDSGRIEILGDGQIEQVKNRIGYMPEERGLYRKMTARKVLAYFGSIKGLNEKEIVHRVPHWLETIGLADWADKKVEELSRGMHQKLQFAVTAINEPELVIRDLFHPCDARSGEALRFHSPDKQGQIHIGWQARRDSFPAKRPYG